MFKTIQKDKMNSPKNYLWYALAIFLLLPMTLAANSGALRGYIVDSESNSPLPGANMLLVEASTNKMVDGTFTLDDGAYQFLAVEPGTYELYVQYVGYEQASFQLTVKAGEKKKLDIRLALAPYDLNAVIVTAPWQIEQIVTSTSSTTVLDEREIEAEVGLSPVTALRKVAGVDLARTGIDNFELGIRGFNDYLSTSTQVLTDFRHAALPSIGGNLFQVMPFNQIDLERIEVLRGPGSSLYGSGVAAGVVHFVTKSPFEHPGTTLMLSGGERDSYVAAVRHAGTLYNNKIGYKVVYTQNSSKDWQFDSSDSLDQFVVSRELRQREYLNRNNNIYGSIAYRVNANSTVKLNLGYSLTKANIATQRSTAVRLSSASNTFFHVQLNSGNYFGQAHLSTINLKSGFLYTAPDLEIKENSTVARVQQQYNFILPGNRGRFIVGADLGVLTPQTEGTINGRFEDDDDLIEVGSYLQATLALNRSLDMTLATRVDYDNINKEFNTGPRAGLVFKLDRKNFFRTFYTRTFSTISSLDSFTDLLLMSGPSNPLAPLSMRVMGNSNGFNYQYNGGYTERAGTDLVASSLDPESFGAPQPIGMDIDPLYANLHETLTMTGFIIPGFTAAESQAILAAISPTLSPINGFSRGALAIPENLGESYKFIETVENIERVRPTINQTFEIGYKGTIADRLIASADIYYSVRENFRGTVDIITPLVFVPNLRTDFQAALEQAFQVNLELQNLGLDANQITQLAALLTAIADGDQSLTELAGSPIAVVQPAENARAGELIATTVNFGKINFWGMDLAAQFFVNSRLDVYGNLSFMNDDFFDESELGEQGTGRVLTLNAPKFKLKSGVNYQAPDGISWNVTMRASNGFPMVSGFYTGDVEGHFLIDVGAGYDLSRFMEGLRVDFNALNMFDQKHRQFVGAPKIGRLIMGRAIWEF